MNPAHRNRLGLTSFGRDGTIAATVEMAGPTRKVTRILDRLSDGDRSAADELMPLLYEELRILAGRVMAQERAGHTLQPTALVHEVFLRLVPDQDIEWKGRAHFAAVAARTMRRVLVNHARDRAAGKRGGGWKRVTLDVDASVQEAPEVDLLALEDALGRITELNELSGRVVELRFYGGLTIAETAHVLSVSTSTVESHWAFARAWLFRELSDRGDS